MITATGRVELDSLGTVIGGTIEGSGIFLVLKGALDGGGTHPITVNGEITVDANDSVDVQGAFKTPASGRFHLLNSASLLLGLSNTAAADTTFSGSGQIVLDSGAAIDLNPSTHVGSVPPKLNNVDDTIEGAGTIGDASTPGSIVLNNEAKGTVEALNGTLTIYSNITNAGVLDSMDGELVLVGNVITNTGSLKAEASSNILLQNTTIRGGTLTGDGTFEADDAVLDGSTAALTNAGTVDMNLSTVTTTLTLKGTINNNGTVELGPSFEHGIPGSPIPVGSDLVIGAAGASSTVTLKGSGEIILDAYGDDYIIGDANLPGGVPTTLNNLSNIEGAGRIGDSGLTLKNGGTIVANGSSPLVIDTGARTVTNTGTLKGFNFSELYINSPLNNAGGKLVADFGQLVAADGASGGTATASGGGTIEFGGPTTTAVAFSDNASHSAALVLDDSVHFKGVISGFAKNNINDEIDLADIDSATAQKVSYTSGVLTIKDDSGHTAQLHFSGTYTLASFTLNDDGHGGTMLTDPPAPTKPKSPPTNAASLFSQFMASWTNPLTALASEVMHSPFATELQPAVSLLHAHG